MEAWLDNERSQAAGWDEAEGEEVGHKSGRRLVEILHKDPAAYDDEDLQHMRQVIGYIKHNKAQRPANEPLENSRWRYALMNWGHDPLLS